jgi:hypothetical protein
MKRETKVRYQKIPSSGRERARVRGMKRTTPSFLIIESVCLYSDD